MLRHWSQSNGSTYPAQLSIVMVWVACNEEIKLILQPAAYGAFSVVNGQLRAEERPGVAPPCREDRWRDNERHIFSERWHTIGMYCMKNRTIFWKERIVQCMMIRQCKQTAIKNSTGPKHMSISNTCANRLPIADTRSRVGKTGRKLLIRVLTLMWWRLPTCAENNCWRCT